MVRATHHSSPPLPSIQRIWSASRNSVATAGVLYVWSFSEFSSAVASERNAGIQRSEAAIRSIRSCAAGLSNATHSPPSAAKLFCGAK